MSARSLVLARCTFVKGYIVGLWSEDLGCTGKVANARAETAGPSYGGQSHQPAIAAAAVDKSGMFGCGGKQWTRGIGPRGQGKTEPRLHIDG